MQEVHPYKGTVLRFSEDNGGRVTERAFTIEELRSEVQVSLNTNKKYIDSIQGFTQRVNTGLIDNGLLPYNVSRSSVFHDIEMGESVGKSIEMELPLQASKNALHALGRNKLYSPRVQIDEQLFGMPETVRKVNLINDVIDALSFEFRQINSHSGEPTNHSVEGLKQLGRSRLKVVFREYSRIFSILHSSIPSPFNVNTTLIEEELLSIISTANYLVDNIDRCTSYEDFEILSTYINDNVQKLPLIRRHWGIDG
jgi:hypothetical protein